MDLAILANVTISAIKKEQESEGSGILTSFRNLGCSMGTAIVGTSRSYRILFRTRKHNIQLKLIIDTD
jgi:hypothetical protein